ncbi:MULTISPECIES: hypothetical protein [unclassified Wolbachia]|nr:MULTISPECIES: hypothetical protein [unclassified Wolbachia]MDE5066978.1 hypothetical protein [Wolbachia endosymbiont of Drosophila leontia]QTP61732.1 hypothetical protein HUB92_02070 [Wolbachia endosymbiont of Wiebesia pumilae]QTP61834.1 hypothetical protein HUB92_02705 [Wolbachia endosymbiont of Wiebesia pumilae]
MQQSHSSVKHWNDIIGALPFWMETSVSYLDDTFFLLSLGYARSLLHS